MSHFKLKADDNVRKPEVKRSEINVYMPVLFICFALAALIWLYVVGLSRITSDALTSENVTTAAEEPTQGESAEPDTTGETPAEVLLPDGSICL